MSLEIDATASRDELLDQARALLADVDDTIANAANLAAFLFDVMDDVNWAGFYFLRGDELLVGPFQGKPACVSIPVGKGVCGTAAASRAIQRVADVHTFAGHIACDAATRSEIVLPLLIGDELLGVLDIDSPEPNRFSEEDERFLQKITAVYIESLE